MKMFPTKAKWQEETYAGRYLKGLSNQNGEHLENLRESNILIKHKWIS